MASLIRSLQCSKIGHIRLLSRAPNASARHFSCSGPFCVREITETETTNSSGKTEIIIEGRVKDSSRKSRLIKVAEVTVDRCQSKANCHPLCRLDFVHEIKHTGSLLNASLKIE